MSSDAHAAEPNAWGGFWANVRTIAYALVIALLIRFTMVQGFRIPTGSMQPSLETGDYILVSKWGFGYSRFSFAPFERFFPHGRVFAREPVRGQIIVFRPPRDPGTDYVKRLVGLPGDRIQMRAGVLFLNGLAVQREPLGIRRIRDNETGRMIEVAAFRETLPGGPSYVTFSRGGAYENENTREFVVPPGHYFFMGDDRDISRDSRTAAIGYVPFDNLVGPAHLVILSFEQGTDLRQPWTLISGFRAERFLRNLDGNAP